jgi:transcriptional regulator with PAS, ATPase and Fis domain
MKKRQLREADRDFYRAIGEVISANPFSEARTELERAIIGGPAADEKKTTARLIARVDDRLARTFDGQSRTAMQFQGEDRTLVRQGMLFHLFHQYCIDFDNHIRQQIDKGDEPCRLSFAGRLLADMTCCGFSRQEAACYFALFFQMRRAYYFIDRIIGTSRCMQDLRRDLWNNIFTHDIGLYEKHLWNRMEDFSTMLLGQTGTGKGLAASAIGRSGYIPLDEKRDCFAESFTRAFVPLNLSQFPEQLLESELFGHKKGAFTGAIENHDGVFSRCSQYGAIFLDEIGEVGIPVQIKLLQVLQDRTFSPVGSHAKKRFQGRVIAATNRPLNDLRQKGLFRDDFYYRLCSDIIVVPPLHQRLQENSGELGELLAHVITTIVGRPAPELEGRVVEHLHHSLPPSYHWPGNVRELGQAVRRILLKERYEGDMAAAESPVIADKFTEGFSRGEYTAQELLSAYCRYLYKKFGTYEEVARLTGLDRRTAKKHIENA